MNIAKIREALRSFRAAQPEVASAFRWSNNLVRSIDRPYVWYTWVSASFTGMLNIGAFALFGFSAQYFIESMSADGRPSMTALLVILGATIVFFGVKSAASLYAWHRREVFERKLHDRLDMLRVNTLRSLDLGRLSDPEFQATLDFANDRGVSSVSRLFRIQGEWISAIAGAVLGLAVIAAIDPILLLLAAIPAIPRAVRSFVIDRKTRAVWERFHIPRRWRSQYRYLITDRHRVTEAKLLCREPELQRRYRVRVRGLAQQDDVINRFTLLGNAALIPIEIAVVSIALLYLGWGLVAGTIAFGAMAVAMGSVQTAVRSFSEISTLVVRTRTLSQDFGYLEKLLDTKPLIDESLASPIHLSDVPAISLKEVCFTYPGQCQQAIRDCTVHIEPGERIAIVGKNGSGKTTLARLLAKVYEPSEGHVLVNNVPTTSFTQASWLRHMLLVAQGMNVPDMQVAEIVSGTARTAIDQQRLERAMDLSAADEFVNALPKGVYSQVGEEWPGGVGLSTGQTQRIALAAAFYRLLDPQVKVAIFDEPMANVDVETRERFYSALSSFGNKTIIVIAHDPLFLQHFERVVVMGEGRIVTDISGTADITAYKLSVLDAQQ